ncbi:mannose-6-phosphate isomerase [Alteromonas sp. KUL156]|uniref:mannose-6-phosphate isomerase, class I n=1 Tax=Tenacibaculum TaxID=104267 RepID=UPI0012E6533E|nr:MULTISPECIES: mannose-6-phosphate isomerase, class I [Tenacibaculum]GFD93148.1 mannose-6-phosphate isomerase [Alteromonas sp. KUL154]GFE01632.1 mannose-6-phosphate isomerase [Alteromonas sp. KUL156]KAF9657589.1 mannose-6-phosphate isomerase, class I [Tenacibaculum mesophilum]MCO7185482.1 mannose-6-phosphate isomerase, class I [Tenacibaculum sp. XPcli2-G]BFF41248.1 mannose-6-phosphate isomerase [Tenacibaculum mesophilum]
MINEATQTFNLLALTGQIQNYDWGGDNYITKLLKRKNDGKKIAEYWLGAHRKAPSIIKTSVGNQTLDNFLKRNLKKCLGKRVARKYGRLPFLFKVLDVKKTLSIQVHPSKKNAEKGFKEENILGIPLTAPYRNYKDDNHKPEIMVALSEFWLLHGFLPKSKLITRLEETPEFKKLVNIFKEEGYFGLYKNVMEKSNEEVYEILKPLIDRITPLYKNKKLDKNSPDFWAAKVVDESTNNKKLDRGIFSIYFFNIMKLNKGEAVFQKEGVPHAYLEGQNIELMANSDNVLRGGLTKKHVDVAELLKNIVFEETNPEVLYGCLKKDNLERVYETEAKDFELSKINIAESQVYKAKSRSVEILIVIDGEIEIVETKSVLNLKKGQSALLKAGSIYKITSKKKATIYKAKVPY